MLGKEFVNDSRFNKSKTQRHFEDKMILLIVVGFISYGIPAIVFDLFPKYPVALIGSLMFAFSFGLGAFFKGCEVIDLRHKRNIKEDEELMLRKIVQEALLKGDYSSINEILKSDNAHSHIIELGFLMSQYHEGSWVEKGKLSYNKKWGENFFELMFKFFKEEKERMGVEKNEMKYSDLEDMLLQSTFLATVKPNIMQEIVDHFDKEDK